MQTERLLSDRSRGALWLTAAAVSVVAALLPSTAAHAEGLVGVGGGTDGGTTSGTYVAVSGTGNASSSQGVAVSGTKTATGVVAASGAGAAYGPMSLSTNDTNSNRYGSLSGAVELAATQCPFDLRVGGSCLALWNWAHGTSFDKLKTGRGLATQAQRDVSDYQAGRAEPNTDVPGWLFTSVGDAVVQFDELISAAYADAHATYLSENRTSLSKTVNGPAGTNVTYSTTITHCLTVQCLETLPSGAQQAVGCLLTSCPGAFRVGSVLSVSPLVPELPRGSGNEDGTTCMKYLGEAHLWHRVNDETGGPGLVDGNFWWYLYRQCTRVHQGWTYWGTKLHGSSRPYRERGCKLQSVYQNVSGHETTLLVSLDPGSLGPRNPTGWGEVSIEFSGESTGGSGTFGLKQAWYVFEGISGGESWGQTHWLEWSSGSRKGDWYAKDVKGVEGWKSPRGDGARWVIKAGSYITNCSKPRPGPA